MFRLFRPSKSASSSDRRGAIVVWAAVLLIVMAGMCAFAIDIGYMLTAHTEIQRSVDAGALAGAGAIVDGPGAAEATVRRYIQANLVGGRQIESQDIVIESGGWDTTTQTFLPNATNPSAIRVRATQRALPHFFGPVFGRDMFEVERSATARYQPREIVVVLDYSASMNDDSELKQIHQIGRAPVEQNLYDIWVDMGSPTFGNMTWAPVYIASNNVNQIKDLLGLDSLPYPFPSGSWNDYIQYVRTSSTIRGAGYQKHYGYLTLVNYWLEQQPQADETPGLWKTRAQPITAVKDAVTVFLAYLQEVDTDDRVGLAVYTSRGGDAVLEHELTRDFKAIEDISRQRQAGHYDRYTNIGAGLRAARLEMENNARPGAFKMIALMTDGQANRPSGNANGLLRSEARKCADRGYPVITISLGAGADSSLMREVAHTTGGIHFNIPGGQGAKDYEEDLKKVFKEIAGHRPLSLVN